jgi:hypothetical protein
MFVSPPTDSSRLSRPETIGDGLDPLDRAKNGTFSTCEEAVMDDDAIWATELSLWKGDHDLFRDRIDPAAQMALPVPPFIFAGEQAIMAVQSTPNWSNVAFEDGTIARPHSDLIVVAYMAHAQREAEEAYIAHCTTTYSRSHAGEWHVVQHQQTPRRAAKGHR